MSRPDKRKYPLKKIVGYDGHYEILECGHKIRTPDDIYGGPRYANSRRCRYCYTQGETNVTPQQ